MITKSKTPGTCLKDQLRNILYIKIIQIQTEYAYIFRITKGCAHKAVYLFISHYIKMSRVQKKEQREI